MFCINLFLPASASETGNEIARSNQLRKVGFTWLDCIVVHLKIGLQLN